MGQPWPLLRHRQGRVALAASLPFLHDRCLYTQTLVVPYLIPMLENAGANVFTPRERDWQRNEVIVDNDQRSSGYLELATKESWKLTGKPGFALHGGTYADLENPFQAGSARQVKARKRRKRLSEASYQPYFPESGRYAVYVSYQTLPKSVDDAEYTVYHKGQATTFHVNQQMGGGTWVYLGTFDFDRGSNAYNRVVLSNYSRSKGVVTTDAVRFGGGMGNITRGGTTSGLPRSRGCPLLRPVGRRSQQRREPLQSDQRLQRRPQRPFRHDQLVGRRIPLRPQGSGQGRAHRTPVGRP